MLALKNFCFCNLFPIAQASMPLTHLICEDSSISANYRWYEPNFSKPQPSSSFECIAWMNLRLKNPALSQRCCYLKLYNLSWSLKIILSVKPQKLGLFTASLKFGPDLQARARAHSTSSTKFVRGLTETAEVVFLASHVL